MNSVPKNVSSPVRSTGERGVFDLGELIHEKEFWYSAQEGVSYKVEYSDDGPWMVRKMADGEVPILMHVTPYSSLEYIFEFSLDNLRITLVPSKSFTNKYRELPIVLMSKKKKNTTKNNNLQNNNLEDGNPAVIDELLEDEYSGTSLREYLDMTYPLFTPDDMDLEELLRLRHSQYHSIIVACKMAPYKAKDEELLIAGRLRQLELEIETIKDRIAVKQDMIDLFG